MTDKEKALQAKHDWVTLTGKTFSHRSHADEMFAEWIVKHQSIVIPLLYKEISHQDQMVPRAVVDELRGCIASALGILEGCNDHKVAVPFGLLINNLEQALAKVESHNENT